VLVLGRWLCSGRSARSTVDEHGDPRTAQQNIDAPTPVPTRHGPVDDEPQAAPVQCTAQSRFRAGAGSPGSGASPVKPPGTMLVGRGRGRDDAPGGSSGASPISGRNERFRGTRSGADHRSRRAATWLVGAARHRRHDHDLELGVPIGQHVAVHRDRPHRRVLPTVLGTGRLPGRHLDRAAGAIPTVLTRPVIGPVIGPTFGPVVQPVIGPTFGPVVRPVIGPVGTRRGSIAWRRTRRTRRLRGGHPAQSPGERDGHQRRRGQRSDTHGHLLRLIRVDRTEPSRAGVVLPERMWFSICRRYVSTSTEIWIRHGLRDLGGAGSVGE
jgi:hypothetical protein